MKKILMVLSQYRVCERILPTIPKLSKKYNLDCYLIYQMSRKHQWPGDDDPRKYFYQTYSKDFNKIFDEENPSFNNYDLILTDDNRVSSKTNLENIYQQKKGVMISCFHGPVQKWNNVDFFEKGYKKIYDKTLVLGRKDCLKNYCVPIGIPSNDILKNQSIEHNHILVIVNFLGNIQSVIGSKPFPITFDERLVREIDFESLQKDLNLPIIIKLKSREGEGDKQVERNTSYVKSIMPDVDYSVIVDGNNDDLICNSKLVISCPGTFALKSIQLGIPTILIEGSNEDGHFPLFKGFVPPAKRSIKQKIDEMMKSGKDDNFINEVIEGGIDFSSTKKMIEVIEGCL
tara:strand:+ start:3700 stop:4731 length:1032 start_codon:yes stop_codon:yes gene_type:complete